MEEIPHCLLGEPEDLPAGAYHLDYGVVDQLTPSLVIPGDLNGVW